MRKLQKAGKRSQSLRIWKLALFNPESATCWSLFGVESPASRRLWASCTGSQSYVQRIDYKQNLLVRKSSRYQVPEYISNMLKSAANDLSLTTLRTAANGKYVVPRTNRRLGGRAFSVAAAKLWNSLPTDLKTATCSTDAFKRRLKTWLFKRAYDWHSDYYYYNYFINVLL